ncbi:B12-binding domain-containing radical SAM protein [bacterium]|nr:B12-binding domain-containing radical SAM protein [bacterium]
MKKVLFVNPPDEMESMFGVGEAFVQKYEPLGMLYIAATTREAGYEVHVVDAHAEDLDVNGIKDRIREIGPDAVGISTLTCSGALVWELGRWIKAEDPSVLIVLGNVHASVYADQYLMNGCCDVVVHGEGEDTFVDVLRQAANGRHFDGIPSISWLDNGVVRQTSPAIVIEDLDRLPYPARDLVNQKLYSLTEISNQNYVTENGDHGKTMVTSRGCVFRCEFCVVHAKRKQRYNVVEKVVDEMEMLERDYGASYVYIMDPLFMGRPRRVIEICDEIKRRGLSLKWGCDAHVNLITPPLIQAMASANCFELSLGIESGVQRLLDAVHKMSELSRVTEAVKTIRTYSNIRIEGLFILGLPGETYAESLETIRFATTLDLDMAQFSIMTPYPGSPLFEELRATGELDTGVRPDGSVDIDVWKRYSSYICFTDVDPIWVTPTQDIEQLRGLQKKALRRFYLRPKQIVKQIKRLRADNILESARIAINGFF